MLEKEVLDNGIIKISTEGIFTLDDWRAYRDMLVEMLEATDEKLYVLSDFSKITKFVKEIVPEVGTAPHLTHEKLGLIVLLGGNALQNFILALTENRANRDNRDSKMRIHTEYDRAMETLLHMRTIHKSAKK